MRSRALGDSSIVLSLSWATGLLAGMASSVLAQPPGVRLNEVRATSGSDDWVELYNPTAGAVSLAGWTFKDDGEGQGHTYALTGTLSQGAYLVLDESTLGVRLGEADSARLFDATGAEVDSYTWTSAAKTSHGRCPNGDGTLRWTRTLEQTKGASNDCAEPWPGGAAVATVDPKDLLGKNMSGVAYQPAKTLPDGRVTAPASIWAVKNSPAMLYRLEKEGATWSPATGSWRIGSELRAPDGKAKPDSEGLTKSEWDSPAVYVSVEGKKLGVLRFDTEAKVSAEKTLTATHEWDLTKSITTGAVNENAGLEAIAWVPDSYLVEHGLQVEGKPYDPLDTRYPDHGTGLFFVGYEADGMLYAFSLDHKNGTHLLVTKFASGLPKVMALDFDRVTGLLWAYCDNSCDKTDQHDNQANHAAVFEIETDAKLPGFGTFQRRHLYDAPNEALETLNNEGITMASECVNGVKAFFWTDDDNTDGFALREGTIRCTP